MKCPRVSSLISFIHKFPILTSTRMFDRIFENIFQMTQTDINRIISSAFWGFLPAIVAVIIMIFLGIWMCLFCNIRRRVESKKITIAGLFALSLIFSVLVTSAFLSLNISTTMENTNRRYFEAGKMQSTFEEVLNYLNLRFSGIFNSTLIEIEKVKNSNDYKIVEKSFDFLRDGKNKLKNVSTAVDQIQNRSQLFLTLGHNNITKFAHFNNQKFLVSIHGGIYGLSSILLFFLGLSLCFKTRWMSKILFVFIWLTLAGGMVESSLYLSFPLMLTSICQSFDKYLTATYFLTDLEHQRLQYFFNCSKNISSVVIGNKTNISDFFPNFDHTCSHLPPNSTLRVISACKNVTSVLATVIGESFYNVNENYKLLWEETTTFLGCKGIPNHVEKLKCQFCVDFPNIFVNIGFLSMMGTFLFLIFSFVLPFLWRMRRINWDAVNSEADTLLGNLL